MRGRVKLVHIVTVPESFAFLRGQTRYMAQRGFEITGISSAGPYQTMFRNAEPVCLITIEMTRRITPIRDLVAVARLVRALRAIRPHIVHAHTPKGGLLGMLASVIARVPVRVYHMRGLPLTTATGPRRAILALTERMACGFASRVLCVSHSVRAEAITERLAAPGKIVTLHRGSGNGVDAATAFNPDLPGGDKCRRREAFRTRLQIPEDAGVVVFLGRVVRDKGLVELAEAWESLSERHADAHLVVVGPFEPQDRLPAPTVEILRGHPRIHLIDRTADVRSVYSAADLVVLPTFREGLPNVLLEAAAMRLPVVATRVSGCIDAVVDGTTGTLVPPRNPAALAAAIERYLLDATLRVRHGDAGRSHVLASFQQEAIWSATHEEYRALLNQVGLSLLCPEVDGHVEETVAAAPNRLTVT